MGQLGFFDADKRLAALSAKGDPLEAIDRLVPWERFTGATLRGGRSRRSHYRRPRPRCRARRTTKSLLTSRRLSARPKKLPSSRHNSRLAQLRLLLPLPRLCTKEGVPLTVSPETSAFLRERATFSSSTRLAPTAYRIPLRSGKLDWRAHVIRKEGCC
jgi:hypothetical protein